MHFQSISSKNVICLMTLAFVLVLQAKPALASMPGPVKATDDPKPLALITAVIVADQLKTEAAATEVNVTRASTPAAGVSEPAKVNMPLFKNDKLETFAGASVKIVFLSSNAEKRNELTISEKSQVVIGSGYCPWVCKWFADLKDTFQGKTRTVNLDNPGTKYDLEVTAEGEILRVYEGTVVVKKLEQAARLDPVSGSPVNVRQGQPSLVKISHRSTNTERAFSKETSLPDEIRVQSLETLLITANKAAPLPTPKKLEEGEVRDGLLWSSKVEIAAHPSKRTDENGVIVRKTEFDDSVRNDEFIKARFQSIWNKKPESFETLALVYKDWGEATKTLTNIDEAKKLYREEKKSWTPSDKILYAEAQAYEMMGNFRLARERTNQALAKNPKSKATADNILATIQYREGEQAFKRKNNSLAKQLFGLAASSFAGLARLGGDVQSLALANFAQSVRGLANIAQEEKRYDVALDRYELARKNYQLSYRLQESAFSEKAVADIYREQSRIYYALGKGETGDQKFKLSEYTYLKTVENNKDFGEAYCGLASLYILTEQNDKANENLEKCLAGNPATLTAETEVPNAEGRTKASAIVNFLQVGLVPRFTGEGTFVVSQSIAAGQKVRRGTEVTITLGHPPGSVPK